MAAIGSDGRVASKRVIMLVALLLGSCCVGHGSGDEAHVGCIENERRALLAIKSDMHGPDDRFSSWTGEDCCGWRGVACDDSTGHVTKLDLRYRYTYSMEDEYYTLKTMGGSKVNPSLQLLKHLKYLDLSMNNFSGASVPDVISSLVHLEYLNLSHAMFDGPIPPRFGNLSNLRYLDLQGWHGYYHLRVDDLEWLTGIPSLKYLDMSEVNLSNATNWLYTINSIPKLRVLCLSEANLPFVPSPSSTFNLTAMARLDLSKNYNIMATMLRWLSNATSLEYLDLSGCGSLTVEPPQVAPGALINLKGLDLSSNSLEGDIVGILSNVSGGGLKHLDLSQNYFTGTITRIVRSLRHLEHLDLSDNSNVAGHIPDLLGNLTSLRHLSLRDNNLIDGEIPPTMGHYVRLEYLDLSHTRITGDVPSSIGNLSDLVYLDLAGCSITGQIPPSVGNLTELEYLDLSSNNVVGSIPETIGSMVHLETLNLFDNSVAGQLPETMGRLHCLKSLDIADNKLSGQLPTAMGDLVRFVLQ